MKITIESTDKIVELRNAAAHRNDTVEARIWEGQTDTGIKIHAYITLIAATEPHDARQFERELQSRRAPSPEIEAIPMRLIL